MAARGARKSLLAFTEFTNPLYVRAGHHERICDRLEAVERGEIDRLMIFMPPRHGKSELASKRFPAWCLGRDPKRQIIAASYNSDLANDFGRSVRNLVAEPEFGQVFPNVSLAPDSQAANRMNTNHKGAYVAAGVGTAVTGRGAHIALIDDPFKDREEADSERRRDLVWDWYRSTLYTRLMPGGAIVLIQTRWHEDDLAGRLLEHEGDQWEVLELPAISKAGEPLWPEWYNLEALNRIKATIGPREWYALYQQQPQPDEGTFFKKDWFRRFDARPKDLRYYMTSDHAPGDSANSDWNVFRIWGIDPNQHIYMVDGCRSQGTMDEALGIKTTESGDVSLAEFGGLPLIRKWKPLCWFPEDDNNWKASKAFVKAAMRRLACHCRIEEISPHGQDKPTKARALQAKASMGEVWFPNGPLGDAIIDEFVRFPAGKHDDEVDAASIIGRAIDQAHPAIVLNTAPKIKRDGYWPTQDDDGDWKVV